MVEISSSGSGGAPAGQLAGATRPSGRLEAHAGGSVQPAWKPQTRHGFLTEIFPERRHHFQTHAAAWLDLSGMTGRNQDAIKKTTVGLLKLLHPHRTPEALEPQEIGPLVDLGAEVRNRVSDQLAVLLLVRFGSVPYGYRPCPR